ncbi:MAG: TonB-dependent receptor [Hyphomonadaceae bacterium]
MSSYYSFSFASILALAVAMPAMAQETVQPVEAAAKDGVISYTPADFAAARPNTAMDMINRLPGFTFDGGDSVRGFAGAAGNVLIDGQRPTIKTDSLGDTLARITIDQVERIDLIRGGAPGIDMQGRTVIANVIRKKVDTFQQVFSARSFIFAQTGDTIPGWNYQATKRSGDHQFDLSLARGISYDDSVGYGWRYRWDANGTLLQTMRANNEGDGPVHSLRMNYKGPQLGGTFSANMLVSTDEFKDEQILFDQITTERYRGRSANDRGEIGLNYTRPLGDSLEWESLVLSKAAQGAGNSLGVCEGFCDFDGDGVDDGGLVQTFSVQAEAGESIGRSVLRYKYSPELQFEGGGEVAFNYREQSVALTSQGVPVPLPASDVRVEELRGEGFVQGTWRPSPKLSFEAGLRYERSTITQSGQTDRERTFNYPKPRVLATWSPTDDDQVRFRVERQVGQLNFQDFASNVSLSTNVLSAGNAELQPDKTWIYEAAIEHRFWENGAAVLTLRHEDITDVVDVFPFLVPIDANNDGVPDDANNDGIPDQRLVAGPGNIGDGTNDVAEFTLTLPLKPFGIDGGELKASGTWQNGEVTDPLTGEKRRISGQRPQTLNVNFRQDLPEQKLTWGLGWFGGWEEDNYRLEEVQSLRLKNFFSSFIEYKPTTNFTLRAELNNLDPYRFTITRFVYDGPRDTGALAMVEQELRKSQVIGMLSVRWTVG